jgi:AcrR family transcriptional regulator
MTHSLDRVESILAPMAGSDSDEPFLTAKGRATRDRIVDCATELVLSEGFSGLSIDKVRKSASVSGSQMTHYFTDKNSLLGAIVSRRTQVLLDFHRQPALRDLDTFEDFERWAELTMRFGRRKKRVTAIPVFGPLVVELSKCDDKTRDLLAQGYREWSELLTAGLQRMKDRGELVAEANPQQLAWVLMSAHQGGDMLTLAYRRPWPDHEALKFALSYLDMFASPDRASTAKKATRQRTRRASNKP